ncbi:class I SAM-dependent methyltransferase [bacterium]|nr:class I SAM-dependent methyltransferase [bacterium]
MQKQLKFMNWTVKLPSNMFTGFLMINHPPVEGACEFGWGDTPERNDELLSRVCDYFDTRLEKENIVPNSVAWGSIIPTHMEFVDYLKDRNYEKLHDYLSNMFTKPLCHGTAQGHEYYERLIENKDEIMQNTGFAIYDKFITLMEATGVIPVFSPEQYQKSNDYLRFYAVSPDKYIDLLEEHLGYDLIAPKYQGNHFGIQTEEHGLYSDRDIMCLGVAIRIAESYWNRRNIRIADIGGGVGHLEYYLHKLGFTDITMIDIPTVSTSAKYFLETNLGENDIKLISPEEFTGEYDLVVNFDGLPTYGEDAAKEYIEKISKNTKHFLSINREVDDFRISDICNMTRVSRNQFWYRKGYVEEDYVPERS